MARRPGVSWLVCFLFFSTVASSCAGQQLANQPRETFRTAETVHGLGGPVTYISADEGAAVEKTPGDTARGWDLWKRKALGQ